MKSLQQIRLIIAHLDPHQVHRVVFALLIGLMIGFGTATFVASPKLLDRSAQATSVLKNPDIEASKSSLIQAPIRLQLPRQQIDLSVLMGSFNKSLDDWYIDDRHAFFATLSSLPAQDTNTTIIYGHNTDIVLGKTTSIQRGDSLIITHSDGRITKWRFISDKFVEPDDVKIFSRQSEVPTVVLLTCNGASNERRRLMFFEQI